jgi:hypothetical protein
MKDMYIKETKQLHKITSDERTKRRLNMATPTDDGDKVYRITNDGFADNAVYYATCMTNYLLKRIQDDSEDYLTFEHDNLFQSCISTIEDDLLTNKNIFTLSQLLELFSELLPSDRKESYIAHRLQQKLERHFDDLITIQPQQGHGMSNLINSSAISTPEALGAATRIKADMHSAAVHDLSNVVHEYVMKVKFYMLQLAS